MARSIRTDNYPSESLKIGLLPLYMDLFDQAVPKLRSRVSRFVSDIARELGNRGVEILASPLCARRKEVRAAVTGFEQAKADALVTLHATYSPSLETAPELARTRLPLIVLDTTPRYDFGRARETVEVLLNQGIHGVQDLCNLLGRHGKGFTIEAGHWQTSDVLDRVVVRAQRLRALSLLKNGKVGLLGERFPGMGDFRIARHTLKVSVGAEVVQAEASCIQSRIPPADDPAVTTELEQDRQQFRIEAPETLHRASIRVGLAVRRWLAQEQLDAFTMNPLSLSGLEPNTLPFLEASKAMARGVGYAGEGDFLTALMTGVLSKTFGEATFTEMFCPDWKNDRIFLSHIAEVNYRVLSEAPRLIEKPYTLTGTASAVVVGRFRRGPAVLVNLAPTGSNADDSLRLILIPGTVTGNRGDGLFNTIHGWFRPAERLERLLPEYSYQGGTHHSVLVYGNVAGELSELGRLMGWQTARIE
jgi:L-arabinose isomerase